MKSLYCKGAAREASLRRAIIAMARARSSQPFTLPVLSATMTAVTAAAVWMTRDAMSKKVLISVILPWGIMNIRKNQPFFRAVSMITAEVLHRSGEPHPMAARCSASLEYSISIILRSMSALSRSLPEQSLSSLS